MALAHTAETIGEYVASIIDAAIQTNLSNTGISNVSTFASGAASDYRKVGADAFFIEASTKIITTGTSNSITDSDKLKAYVFDTKVYAVITTKRRV